MTTEVKRDPKTDHLLTSENAALVLIDYQPGLVDGVNSQTKERLINNVVALTKAANLFELPIVLSTVGVSAGYQQETIPELLALLPDTEPVDRSTVNAWEHEGFPADPAPGSVEQVADVVAFLVSKRASHVSGTTLAIDGGASAR